MSSIRRIRSKRRAVVLTARLLFLKKSRQKNFVRNFVSPRFLERKLGKELPAKLRFASGKENGAIGVWDCAESGLVTVTVKVIVKVIVSVIVMSECRGEARRNREKNFFEEGFRPAGRVPLGTSVTFCSHRK